MRPFFVYILRCRDGSDYVGQTDDLRKRFSEHESGAIPGFTPRRRPVSLVFSQEFASREEARAAELRIKGWSRAKKEALIGGDWAEVGRLSRTSHAPKTN